MFDRFTVRARRVLFYARSQVSQLGSSAIEPEHILLGVLDEGKGLGSRILARTGGTLDDFRSDIVRRLTCREKVPESDEIPFSASCKRALEYAAEEAGRLLHNYVGTEHLLLGLLREERSVAADVLAARGVRIEAVREAIVELLSRGEQPEPPGPPPTPANTYQWPWLPFVPSRTVHILYSGMRSPEEQVINYPGTHFSAYGFTLEDIIVRAWRGIAGTSTSHLGSATMRGSTSSWCCRSRRPGPRASGCSNLQSSGTSPWTSSVKDARATFIG